MFPSAESSALLKSQPDYDPKLRPGRIFPLLGQFPAVAEPSVVLKHQFSELTIQLPSLDGSSAQPLIRSAQTELPNPVTPQQRSIQA